MSYISILQLREFGVGAEGHEVRAPDQAEMRSGGSGASIGWRESDLLCIGDLVHAS